LEEVYTPNLVELVWAEKRTRERTPHIGLLVLLKTFQRLGYFVMLLTFLFPYSSMWLSVLVVRQFTKT
jgi:hypothetical protein